MPSKTTCKSSAKSALQVILDIAVYLLASAVCFVLFAIVPPLQQGFYCSDLTIRKPRKDDTVPASYLMAVTFFGPLASIIILEFFSKFLHSRLKTAQFSTYVVSVLKLTGMLLYGLAVTAIITDVIKLAAGRLRPHFLNTCSPNMTSLNCTENLYIEHVECAPGLSPRVLNDIRKSFPSGHSSIAMFSATFFVMYIESRLFCRLSLLLKSAVQLVALSAGLATAASRVADNRHHVEDVIVGAMLGVLVGVWTMTCLSRQLRCESITQHDAGGDPATPLMYMPCRHQNKETMSYLPRQNNTNDVNPNCEKIDHPVR